ncbi:MAG: hypothetical protein MI919_30570, partial [Holophagales bacterium]|nr:hypothetical protein [Holophagales bacterium]
MDWVGRIVAERRRGEARWLYRASLEAEAVEVSAEGLAAELAAGRASEKGWIWTPGLCRWIPAAQLEFVRERFCPAATPPPLPPLRSGSNPFRALLDHARTAVRQWRRLLGVWFLPAAQLLPGFASVLNRGWRLELVRRGPGADLPEGKYWPRYLANGAVLWGMSFLYLLPVTILLLLDSFSWLFEMVALVQYALGVILSADPATGLGSMLAEGGLDFLLKSGFLVFYPIATWPLYRVAMLRYAMTRRWRVFVPGPTNLRLTRRAYPLIMNAFVQNKVLWALYLPVSSLVAVTGIGAPVVLALFGPLRLITTAYFYRDLLDQLARLEPEAFGLQASTADAAEEEAAPLPTRAPALSPAAGSPWPWCLTRDHARPESVSVDDWATTLGTTIRAAAIGADGGSRVAVWVPGMWRWETPADTYAFLERFPEPTEALAGRAPIPEPAESFTAQLRPKRIWHDLRDLLGADEPEKPAGRRRDWLGLWKGRAGWIVALQFLPVIGSIVNRGW